MSLRQVLATVYAALEDPGTGLAARANALEILEGLVDIETAYKFEQWLLSGQMKQAGAPNVSVGPSDGAAMLMLPQESQRDADWRLDIKYETFSADPTVIQNNVATTVTALLQVLDTLREYSDAHGGTILQVREPVGFRFGQFSGASSTNGFTATVVIHERGNT